MIQLSFASAGGRRRAEHGMFAYEIEMQTLGSSGRPTSYLAQIKSARRGTLIETQTFTSSRAAANWLTHRAGQLARREGRG